MSRPDTGIYAADILRANGLTPPYQPPDWYAGIRELWQRATGGPLSLIRGVAGALLVGGFTAGTWLAAAGLHQVGVWMLLVVVPAASAYAWTFTVQDAVGEVMGRPDAQPPASPPTASGRHRQPTEQSPRPVHRRAR